MTDNWRHLNLLIPPEIKGTTVTCDWPELDWINELGIDVFAALFLRWPSHQQYKMPQGHDLYIVSFNLEPFDVDWVMEECARHDAPVIVLNEGLAYDFPLPPNVHFFPFVTWHLQLQRMLEFHPVPKKIHRIPRYKASAVCNRVTQSKVWVFTALMQYLASDDCLIKLSKWIEPKNVHSWQPTGDAVLDELTEVFRRDWLGQTLDIDDWNEIQDNNERTNSNPWQPSYINSALCFTNESYHYSFMQDQWGSAVRPGPNISEKTLKPLLAGCAFIAVGQHNTHGALTQLGFQFDYCDLDLSWDNDPGNVTRFRGIVELIRSLEELSAADIYAATKLSSDHNQDHILSGRFEEICTAKNEKTVSEIFSRFGARH